ncbi:MAG TPA: tetraacyldisaccharide 4'-kinase [Polyangiaceae bacterium]|nr:tetraacyldisaccharide 4'-kinase [Polyangiaceae bacterium]
MLALQTALEQGRFRGSVARACATAWAHIAERAVVRPLALPSRTRVLAVGGATLGGSGKTPLAIACAAELAAGGARVAFVGHAYRAKPGRARVVAAGDALAEVGDEALVAAQALGPAGVRVVVAPTRSDAVAFAAREADVLVLDGVAQTSPVRATLALLAVDALEPWGRARSVAPCGDLRAPMAALLRACDGVVAIGDCPRAGVDVESEGAFGAWRASMSSSGARVGDTLRTWDDLGRMRLGLLCAIARPERVVRSLQRRGVAVRAVVRARDHGPLAGSIFARAALAGALAGIDLWLATPKCSLHFALSRAGVGNVLQAPFGTIEHTLVLSEALSERLRCLAAP